MESDPNVIMQIIQSLLGNAWFNVLTAGIAFGAAISAVAPSKIKKTGWFGNLLQFIADISNVAGLNVLKAKNADDV